ncbi:MAG: hypothetical protein M3430_11985 [Acidobacteriota bacterium]|nr:hypothetical protein [Acidobacteriota bacterium]
MKDEDESGRAEERPQLSEPENAAGESGNAEGDSPAATEENEGMSTVLGTDPFVGVQGDAVEE